MVALLPVTAHATGETSARPQVRVTPPPDAGAEEDVELDDLPGPPLEIITGATRVALPAIPDFARPASDGKPRKPSEPAASVPAVSVVTEAPMRKVITLYTRNASVDALNACNEAIVARRFPTAITACQAAIAAWEGNHLAWYGLANSYMAGDDWQKAREALERAVTLRPDQGMYQMMYGIALYESERAIARQARAREERAGLGAAAAAERMPPKLDAGRTALVRATTIAPGLWRAHIYLGYIFRDLGDPRAAAEELTLALSANPGYRSGYIALAELYRRWGQRKQALAVALAGTANVPRADAADLWFEAALCHEELSDEDSAIAAFNEALAITPSNTKLKLYRGWLYYVRRKPQAARTDLVAVMKSSDPKLARAKELAEQILKAIARGLLPQDAIPTCKMMNGCKMLRSAAFFGAEWLEEEW